MLLNLFTNIKIVYNKVNKWVIFMYNDTNTNKIGKMIKRERSRLGLTQAELGKKINVSKQTISNWENGNRIPDTFSLEKLSKIFGVTVDYLLGNEETDMERLEKNLQALDPRIQQAYRSLQKMDEEDLNFTLELIKMIENKNKNKKG